MKRNLLALCVFALAGATTFAQNKITLVGGNNQNLSGTTMSVEFDNTDEIYIDLNVVNQSGSTVNSIASRRIISAPASWEDQVCYGNQTGGGCYTPTSSNWSMNSGDAITLADGDQALANLKIHPMTAENAVYRYYFGTVNDPYQDSMEVEITSVASVKEVKKSYAISVAPNPATDNFSVKVPGIEKGSIKIVDVLGNVILQESFNGSKNINVNSFRNGVYFVIINGEGMNTINRKVVVRH